MVSKKILRQPLVNIANNITMYRNKFKVFYFLLNYLENVKPYSNKYGLWLKFIILKQRFSIIVRPRLKCSFKTQKGGLKLSDVRLLF